MSAGEGMRVVGIDPGVTTGLAVVTIRDGEYVVEATDQISVRAESMTEEVWRTRAIAEWVDQQDADRVAIEDFVLRRSEMDRTLLSPVRIISSLLTWWEAWYAEDKIGGPDWWEEGVRFQQPAEAKAVVTDERLKRWGLWVKGQRHARDAVRHATLLLRKFEAG